MQAEKAQLEKKIETLKKTTVIVQSESYLAKISGTLTQEKRVELRTTYFTTRGRQIKIHARLWANQKILASFGTCFLEVYYVYAGKNVNVYSKNFDFSGDKWDFHHELSEIVYLPLDKVPNELFGKVPLYILLRLRLYDPVFSSNPNFLIFFEVTAYDVYPP